eukprot:GHVN01033746.1.p1 GENE.GHVN01033746.1~~GHVN01033746.1.p1  ORF type:complete len:160 (+),score=11.31 GHVN01033746.1:322-801(+)
MVQDHVADPLATIFNNLLTTATVPQASKLANVSPVYKKGSKADKANYRHISLTSVVGKLFESILRDRLLTYFLRYKLSSGSKSVAQMCFATSVDFAKMFDKIPHLRLLGKLEARGVCGPVLHWIREWLFERKQRVVIWGALGKPLLAVIYGQWMSVMWA